LYPFRALENIMPLFRYVGANLEETVRKSVFRCDAAYLCLLISGSTRLRSQGAGQVKALAAGDLSQVPLRCIFVGCRIRPAALIASAV
jgi:hypothetical protein